jgi:hypothetical protein
MSQPALAIPYERQSAESSAHTCGAACLSMVYRSLDQQVPQREIWPRIAQRNLYGRMASTTCLMAADAINRGFAAVALQARDPLRMLRLCREFGIHAILNHRLKPESGAGHYSVFLDIDDTHVTLHDPLFGPARWLPHAELLDLWLPRVPGSEIAGNFLIGIAAKPVDVPACEVCHTRLPASILCPRCKNTVTLRPAPVLACLNDSCPARMWNYVCCPSCDLTWSFTSSAQPSATPVSVAAVASAAAPPPTAPPVPPKAPTLPSMLAVSSAVSAAAAVPAVPSAPVPPSAPSPAPGSPLDLPGLFAEIDKFCTHILTIPGAAEHPEIKKQLDFIASCKDELTKAVAEEEAAQNARFAQLAAIKQQTQATREAHQKKLDALNKPLAPLDGDALARTLLKNLGILR